MDFTKTERRILEYLIKQNNHTSYYPMNNIKDFYDLEESEVCEALENLKKKGIVEGREGLGRIVRGKAYKDIRSKFLLYIIMQKVSKGFKNVFKFILDNLTVIFTSALTSIAVAYISKIVFGPK